jgi:hypothetical protein
MREGERGEGRREKREREREKEILAFLGCCSQFSRC